MGIEIRRILGSDQPQTRYHTNAHATVEGVDSVHIIVPRRVLRPGVIRLLTRADKHFPLRRRERIAFGEFTEGNPNLARSARPLAPVVDRSKKPLDSSYDTCSIALIGVPVRHGPVLRG
jgi:hypothetical protein